MNYSHEFILLLDKDNRILHVNNFFLDLMNTPRAAILGKNFSYFSVSPSPSQTILDSIQSCLKSDISEHEITIENDIHKTYFIRTISIVFCNGTKGTAVSMEDISDKKNAVFLELKYNTLLNLVSNSPHQGILICKNEHVIFANKQIEKLFGLACQRIPLFYLMERIIPEDRDCIRKQFSECQENKQKISDISFRVEGASGIRSKVSGRLTLFDESGVISYFLLLTDIPE
jgi:PAS domain S-box-containing protein